MSGRTERVIGTSLESILQAENEVGFVIPPSFREWLRANNGTNVEGIQRIYPIFDERDPRKTWDSISRNFKENWAGWIENFIGYGEPVDFTNLLPFADIPNGDLYCFDYSLKRADGEVPVVLWSHETGETEPRANSFAEFIEKAEAGSFEND